MGMDFYPSDDKSTTSNVIIDGKYTILCDSIEYIIKLSNMQSELCFWFQVSYHLKFRLTKECDSFEYIIKLSNMQSKLCFLVSSVLPFEVEVDKKKGLYNSEFRAIYVEKHLF